ncbi:MAG: nucleotidyltransferase [Erysipelotrichia bacterium]|nr:nucleotidyltransferase [Erysipelotrichia bacterium]NCC53953.1 nucleotidyltransferase [Erysipelotrichia bacterium]
MKDPILVVLAAGMGSRYGGLKQIDPIGPNGEIILELSAFDAIQAGFKKIVFIIKHEIEADFKAAIGDKLSQYCEVEYVFQDINKLPQGCSVPEGRVKPWGTAHAIMCCKEVIDAPFAVINADDYYGQSAFKTLYDFLTTSTVENEYAMVGYRLGNTVSEYGSVARGVCNYENGKLTNVRELTKIEVHNGVIEHTLDEGKTWEVLAADSLVSMNMWGFKANVIEKFENRFVEFFKEEVPNNPLKAEYFIPMEVGRMLRNKEVEVKMLSSNDKWYGVTYQEDKPMVKAGIAKLMEEGKYPQPLWK